MKLKNKYLFFIFFLSCALFFSFLSQEGTTQESTQNKNICQETQREFRSSRKSLQAWEKEKAPIQKERAQVENKFFNVQEIIKKQAGCSEGNLNNMPQCQTNLEEARQLGKRLNQLDANLAQINKKFRKLDQQKLLAEKKLKVYQCQ